MHLEENKVSVYIKGLTLKRKDGVGPLHFALDE